MRRLVAVLVLLLAGGNLVRAQREVPTWLEVPELGLRVEAGGALVVPHANVRQLRVVIGGTSAQVRYGSIFSRVNTESSNVVMSTRSLEQGIACDLDLTRREGFRLQPGRNSVEIAYQDARLRLHYVSFLIDAGGRRADTEDRQVLPAPAGRIRALIIGIARYAYPGLGIRNLAFADRDAAAFRDFVVSPAGGGAATEDVRVLLNEDATVDRLRTEFSEFFSRARPDDLAFVLVNGHTVADPEDPRNMYLVAHDSRMDALPSTALPLSAIEDLYGRATTKRIVTLADTAHVSALSGAQAAPRHNLSHQFWLRLAGTGERFALASADAGELATEIESERSGAFAQALMRGLRGEADAKRDGTVTAAELQAFVAAEVAKLTGGRQNPVAANALGQPITGSALTRQR
jgi:hypothetical protein